MKPDFRLECKPCGGTGIYVGKNEKAGVGAVCSECDGTGEFQNKNGWPDDAANWDAMEPHVPFGRRRERSGIHTVRQAFWWERKPPCPEVTYTEFLSGVRP